MITNIIGINNNFSYFESFIITIWIIIMSYKLDEMKKDKLSFLFVFLSLQEKRRIKM